MPCDHDVTALLAYRFVTANEHRTLVDHLNAENFVLLRAQQMGARTLRTYAIPVSRYRLKALMGANTASGCSFQMAGWTSMYSSISLPSGSSMYRLWVTPWSDAPTILTSFATSESLTAQLVVALADF